MNEHLFTVLLQDLDLVLLTEINNRGAIGAPIVFTSCLRQKPAQQQTLIICCWPGSHRLPCLALR